MQELRLVAVSEDGAFLVLASAGRGTRFMLPVDDRLRAAVRGQFSRLGQFEIEVENPLRPKEIQSRIRSGETAEAIAEISGIPVERVRWFEGPVLQEREYMAQQAQRAAVRRSGDSAPGPALGEIVARRVGQSQLDSGEAVWDSWKLEDNTWRVRLAFRLRGEDRFGHWVYDPRRRSVVADDEEAARFLDPDAPETNVRPFQPRRSSESRASGDTPGLAAAAQSPAPPPAPEAPAPEEPAAPGPDPAEEPAAVPLVDGPSIVTPSGPPLQRPTAGEAEPGGDPAPETDPAADAGPAAQVPPAPPVSPEPPEPPAAAPTTPGRRRMPPVAADLPPTPPAPEESAAHTTEEPAAAASPEPVDPPEPPERPSPTKAREPVTAAAAGTNDTQSSSRRRGKGRGRRASVPSWDEIMFGSRKSD